MLRRVDSAVPPGTSIVILNPGGKTSQMLCELDQELARTD
jgi:hypothetical protein